MWGALRRWYDIDMPLWSTQCLCREPASEASGGRLPGAWRLASHGGGEVTNQQQRLSLLASWIILDHLGSSWIILDHLGNSESWKISYYPDIVVVERQGSCVMSCQCIGAFTSGCPRWHDLLHPALYISVPYCHCLCKASLALTRSYPILPDLTQLTPEDSVGPWSFRRKVLVPRTATVKVPRDLPFVEFKLVTAGGHRRNFRTTGQGGWEVCECCWALKILHILPRSLQRERPHGSRSISTAAFTADSKRTGHVTSVTSHLCVFCILPSLARNDLAKWCWHFMEARRSIVTISNIPFFLVLHYLVPFNFQFVAELMVFPCVSRGSLHLSGEKEEWICVEWGE